MSHYFFTGEGLPSLNFEGTPMGEAMKTYGNPLEGAPVYNGSQGVSLSLSEVDKLYEINREWAEEQAQKQMDYQTSANKIAMDFSSAEADKERAFQTAMANSAYQRAVQDLKKAGLNPILAYSQGGASVPSVSSATGVTSSGAKATMTDTGYTSHQLDYARDKLAINSALQIAKLIVDFV